MELRAISPLTNIRSYIANAFRKALDKSHKSVNIMDHNEPFETKPTLPIHSSEPSAIDKVNAWNNNLAEIDPPEDQQIRHDEKEIEDHYVNAFVHYRALLESGEAYQRLLQRLQAILELDWGKGSVARSLGIDVQKILEERQREMSLMAEESPLHLDFRVDVSLHQFLRYYYGNNTCKDLMSAVILVGVAPNIQAITCAQYMQQVWPDSGIELLRSLQKAALSEQVVTGMASSPGLYHYRLACTGVITLHAQGTASALRELGVQLGWLCSAFSVPTDADKIGKMIRSVPTIDKKALEDGSIIILRKAEINESFPEAEAAGTCWRNLFQGAVIVHGFPIPRRLGRQMGLEISFELMAGLGDAEYLTSFDGIPVLRGFYTMFVATKVTYGEVQWHFLYSEDNERISYLEGIKYASGQNSQLDSTVSVSNQCRHFVGWSTSINRRVGEFIDQALNIPC
jgi:hypothetical protein